MTRDEHQTIAVTEQREMTALAWHWVAATRTLRDGTPVEAGRTYRLPDGEPPILCQQGYHGSRRALDALQYAPGAIICRVQLSGSLVEQPDDDKLVASERTVLWLADANTVLHEFACDAAELALDAQAARGEAVDPRSRAALAAKRGWLAGTVTDEELAAARAAAWDAAEAAAWDAQNAELERRLLALAAK